MHFPMAESITKPEMAGVPRKDMKKILMVAYHFHPDSEIGGVRTAKFARYLPGFGWQPTILTVESRYFPSLDDTPLGFDCPVFRTKKLPVLDEIYRKAKSVWGSRHAEKSAVEPTIEDSGSMGMNRAEAGTSSIKRFVDALSVTPDDRIGWFFPGLRMALRLMHREKIDVLYSSGPPWTCHLICLAAKKLTGTPWAADFRDPWVIGRGYPKGITHLSHKIEAILEKMVMDNADHILTTTPELKMALENEYGLLLENKCFHIYNGYDEDDFASIERQRDSARSQILFLHAGTLYYGRDPSNLLVALGKLLKEGFLRQCEIGVEFRGKREIDSGGLNEIIGQYHLEEMVKFLPAVKRHDYLNSIMNADVLILMQSGLASTQIPAKTFEYLATGNDIVALIPAGATLNLLRNFDNVLTADPENTQEILACLKKAIMSVRESRSRGRNPQHRNQVFSRRESAETLSLLLDRMMDNRKKLIS